MQCCAAGKSWGGERACVRGIVTPLGGGELQFALHSARRSAAAAATASAAACRSGCRRCFHRRRQSGRPPHRVVTRVRFGRPRVEVGRQAGGAVHLRHRRGSEGDRGGTPGGRHPRREGSVSQKRRHPLPPVRRRRRARAGAVPGGAFPRGAVTVGSGGSSGGGGRSGSGGGLGG
ncbi:hypothetical protein I4F81_007569 [Pyropia yezoensis]|uniref:Uncharacterized protein n=1 Tax=Pyropia yezoensis TaxID=2788 RepID=A0ACC3C585_PYRYE|nr:hypothetical protein I4F81_007569 [Neopyropia yezoensis]